MQGLSIIEGKELENLKERLANIERNQLALMKLIQQLLPATSQSSSPGYLSVDDIRTKYRISTQTIYNKLNLFKIAKNREIDRLPSGTYSLINELEFQEALRLKSDRTELINSYKSGKKEFHPNLHPQK